MTESVDRRQADYSRTGARAGLFRTLLAAGVVAALAWQIITRTFVAYLVTASLDKAQVLAPNDPVVLLAVAEQSADRIARRAITPGADTATLAVARAELRQQANSVLAADPLNPAALRMLGQIEDAEGHLTRATALMDQAARLSRQETLALLWLLKHATETHDLAVATHYADALLSTRAVAPYVVPVLAGIAEDPRGVDGVKRLLATNPRWRPTFFAMLPASVTHARTPLSLLSSLKDTAAPASASDYAPYLNFLLKHNLYELAYYSWLQSLPPEQMQSVGLLHNGRFATPPSGAPFDWTLSAGSGVLIEFAQAPGQIGHASLLVQFRQGRIEFGGVSQVLALAPGTYRLQGNFLGDLNGRRGLEWQVSCLGSGASIGQTSPLLGTVRNWQVFEASIAVPARDCRAQLLKLVHTARSSSEQFISGLAWFDDLKVSPSPRD